MKSIHLHKMQRHSLINTEETVPHIETNPSMASTEARDRLQSIITNDMNETIEQISQILEACSMKKVRLLEQLDGVSKAVEAVRNECECIDTTIASRILHLNKLVAQIVQQMALIHIPDPPMPPEPMAPPLVEIDLSAVHDRLSGLDHMLANLTKSILEKEETVLYVINKRPGGHGSITTSVYSPAQPGDMKNYQEMPVQDEMIKLQTLLRSIQNGDRNLLKEMHHHKMHRRHTTAHEQNPLPSFDGEEQHVHVNDQQQQIDKQINHNSSYNHNENDNDEDEETSRNSEQPTIGQCTLCQQVDEQSQKRTNDHHSIASSNYTDRSVSFLAESLDGLTASQSRRLGEALASNGEEIIYYDYEHKMICVANNETCSVPFSHGLVVDLYWWPLNSEWLILSEQGLYRWKTGENQYYDTYEFAVGEIGFRRIAVTQTSIFCLFRYSLMLLELSNGMQMKRLHALAAPNLQYRKLADVSVRKTIHSDGTTEDILGLIWFGSGAGILLEERHVTLQENNMHERLFRHVPVQQGRYARLAPYEDGRAWLISNVGADVFWIVDNTHVSIDQREASATWVKVNGGIPVNAVGFTHSTVCIRLQDGKLQYLEAQH